MSLVQNYTRMTDFWGYGRINSYTGFKVTASSSNLVVTIDQLKQTLGIYGTNKDTLLTDIIGRVTDALEAYNWTTFLTKTIQQSYDYVFPDIMQLACPPAQSVNSIKYNDENGTQQTLDPSLYVVDTITQPGRVIPAFNTAWPNTSKTPACVLVEYKAGYGDTAAAVPPRIKAAVVAMAVDIFEHPEQQFEGNLTESLTHRLNLGSFSFRSFG